MAKDIISLSILIIMLASCSLNANNSNSNHQNPSEDTGDTLEIETVEEHHMKREFCKVDSLQEDYFVLKNTIDEEYYIDNSLLKNFKEGDMVVLLYTDRTPKGNGYSADVYAIYPDNDAVVNDDK